MSFRLECNTSSDTEPPKRPLERSFILLYVYVLIEASLFLINGTRFGVLNVDTKTTG